MTGAEGQAFAQQAVERWVERRWLQGKTNILLKDKWSPRGTALGCGQITESLMHHARCAAHQADRPSPRPYLPSLSPPPLGPPAPGRAAPPTPPLWSASCCCLVTKACPTFCDPTDYSPPGSFVHGILQARILECVAVSFSISFPTQGTNPHLLHWQACSLPLSHLGRPSGMLEGPNHQGWSERHDVAPGPHQEPRPLPPGAPDCTPSRWGR